MAAQHYDSKVNPLGDQFYQKTISKKSLFGEFYNVGFERGGPFLGNDNQLSCSFDWSKDTDPVAPFQAAFDKALRAEGYRFISQTTKFGNYVIRAYAMGPKKVDLITYKLSVDYGPTAYLIAR